MAGRFDRGVTSYTIAEVTVQVAFPEDEVKCKWCPFIRHYDGLNRDKCSLTDRVLFSTEIIGHECPLTILNQVNAEDYDT